jgi:DNA-binding GntR family transcriptional regulator
MSARAHGPQPSASGTLVQKAYEHIQESILAGRLPVGSVISEAVLAKSLGISRTPVGEAIRQLAREGLVHQVPRYGTIVKPIDRREMIELYEMREALESYAAGKAAERADDATVTRLMQFCEVMNRIAEELDSAGAEELDEARLTRFLAADMAFHMTIIEASGNRRMMESVRTMRTVSRIFRTRRLRHDQKVVHRARDYHGAIAAAIRAHNPDLAKQKMAEHIHLSMTDSVKHLEEEAARAGEAPAGYELPPELLKELDTIEQRASNGASAAAGAGARQRRAN